MSVDSEPRWKTNNTRTEVVCRVCLSQSTSTSSLPQQNSRRSNVSCNRVPLPGTVSHLFYIPHTDASTLWHGGPYRRTVTVIIIKNHSVLVRGVHLTLPHPMTPRGTRRRRRLGDAVRKPIRNRRRDGPRTTVRSPNNDRRDGALMKSDLSPSLRSSQRRHHHRGS